MIKVHVWLPDAQHVGHTSLEVRDEYISFWPDGAAGKKDLKIKTSQPGMLVPYFHDDIRNEGNRMPVTVELPNLDEDAVVAFAKQLQRQLPRYQLARSNCSHVVAQALMAGASAKPSFTPHAGHYGRAGRILGIGIWTPDQVLRFVRELQKT